MPIAGNMPIAGGLIDIEHISDAVVVAAAAVAPDLAQTWEQPPGPVGAGLTWLVHAALIVGEVDGFALTDAADSADVRRNALDMSGLVGVVVVGSWLSLIAATGLLCYRLVRPPRQGRRSARPTGVGLLALGRSWVARRLRLVRLSLSWPRSTSSPTSFSAGRDRGRPASSMSCSNGGRRSRPAAAV